MFAQEKPLATLIPLWRQYADLPRTLDSHGVMRIQEDFLHFKAGKATAADVFSWFVGQNPHFSIEAADGSSKAAMLTALWNEDPVAGVAVKFENYTEDEVEIVSLESHVKNAGRGTIAMDRIAELADQHGIDLMLIIASYGHKKGERLEQFYSRFGFSDCGSPGILRRSASPAPAESALDAAEQSDGYGPSSM